jgi:hypothetical protein
MSTRKANLVVRRVGNMILFRQNAETATDEEWAAMIRLIVSLRAELAQLRFIVRTDGGGPSAPQRRSLEEALGGVATQIAIVSDHLKVRFVASTIALFQKKLRCFLVKEFAEACKYLGLQASERAQAEAALKEMETELA